VKRLIVAAFILSACRTVQVPMTSMAMGGSSTPRSAVEQMLNAAKNQDLQGISAVWGDESGLTRDHNPRAEIESRTFIMACVLKNDTQKIGDPAPAGNGRMMVTAELTQGTNSGATRFMTARTKDGRWLVSDVDLPALQNKGFCAKSGEK
jgi:hypothetical protein